ncbi:unnamed protein product, partial [Arabidopsis halleri]
HKPYRFLLLLRFFPTLHRSSPSSIFFFSFFSFFGLLLRRDKASVLLLRRSSSSSSVFFSVATRLVFFFFFFLNPSYKFLTFLFHFWEARRSEECEREASLKSPESSKPEVRLRLKRRI